MHINDKSGNYMMNIVIILMKYGDNNDEIWY